MESQQIYANYRSVQYVLLNFNRSRIRLQHYFMKVKKKLVLPPNTKLTFNFVKICTHFDETRPFSMKLALCSISDSFQWLFS